MTPVTGRAPLDVRERHHLDRGGGPCSRSESSGRLRSVSAAIATLCCRSIRATRTSSGRSCFCAVGPSERSRRDRELHGPSEAWRWRLNSPPPPGYRVPKVERRGQSRAIKGFSCRNLGTRVAEGTSSTATRVPTFERPTRYRRPEERHSVEKRLGDEEGARYPVTSEAYSSVQPVRRAALASRAPGGGRPPKD